LEAAMKNAVVRMVAVLGVFLVLSALASVGWSQSASATPSDNDLNSRFSKALGTDASRIVQHYYLVKNGGVIEFTAKDPNDTTTISALQKYIDTQKDLFEKGKNDPDADVHGKVPDGVPILRKLRNEITFFAVKNDDGAALRMFSVNHQARQAIQNFLKFQINEHKTGDPLVTEQ
jgi:hypothetical protein